MFAYLSSSILNYVWSWLSKTVLRMRVLRVFAVAIGRFLGEQIDRQRGEEQLPKASVTRIGTGYSWTFRWTAQCFATSARETVAIVRCWWERMRSSRLLQLSCGVCKRQGAQVRTLEPLSKAVEACRLCASILDEPARRRRVPDPPTAIKNGCFRVCRW